MGQLAEMAPKRFAKASRGDPGMNTQFLLKAGITVALVLIASALSKRPGLLGALIAALPITSLLVLGWLYADTRDVQRVAAMSMDIFWFVLGGLAFFPVLSLALRAGWQPWLGFTLAGLAAFTGMSVMQALLTHVRTPA
ncbi:MAG: DUF3147 family protein [Pseudomonadota bacterium]|nr:DUF3147 family protein [Pseudomonadota bacterium]